MKRTILKILQTFRYRGIRFRSLGAGVVYKSLSSQYISPDGITLGDNVHIGPGANFDGSGGIEVGNGTIFGPDVTIFTRTHNFRYDLKAIPFDNVMWTAPVKIERFVWVGAKAIIMPGVTVGEGAIIGAGAVVSRPVEPCTVVAGNPATKVGTRNKIDFYRLASDETNFCYIKLGHQKIFKPRPDRS